MGWWDLVTKWSCAICPQGCVSTFILLECLPQEWFAGLNCSFCQTVCVMVVWRTKVQCDAHGQVGGCKMDSLGWDGWCLLHKSEFFTICLILVEKLYQNTDSLAWRIHLFSPWYSRWIAWRTWFLMKAGMCGSFNVRSYQNIDNNSNNNLLNFYCANINIKFSFAHYSIVIYLYTSWKYYIQN